MPLIKVPLRSGGCYILLTEAEYLRALARGKRDRRAQALSKKSPFDQDISDYQAERVSVAARTEVVAVSFRPA